MNVKRALEEVRVDDAAEERAWAVVRAAYAHRVPAPPAPEVDGDALGRIAELGPEQRAVVVLRYVLEYTPGEIAEILDLPRGTVNSRLRRGLDRMKGER